MVALLGKWQLQMLLSQKAANISCVVANWLPEWEKGFKIWHSQYES